MVVGDGGVVGSLPVWVEEATLMGSLIGELEAWEVAAPVRVRSPPSSTSDGTAGAAPCRGAERGGPPTD